VVGAMVVVVVVGAMVVVVVVGAAPARHTSRLPVR